MNAFYNRLRKILCGYKEWFAKQMSCVTCNKVALINLSSEISVLAERFACEAANSVGLEESVAWLDIYMMYYRIEYTRLYDARKVLVVCVCHDYGFISDDTEADAEAEAEAEADAEEKFNFDITAAFCFHEKPFDPECANCISMQEKP
jgi:hypothetical protein